MSKPTLTDLEYEALLRKVIEETARRMEISARLMPITGEYLDEAKSSLENLTEDLIENMEDDEQM